MSLADFNYVPSLSSFPYHFRLSRQKPKNAPRGFHYPALKEWVMRAFRGITIVLPFVAMLLGSITLFGGKFLPNPLMTPDSSGVLATYNTNGGIDINNAFFQDLGANGRTCNTCHISTSAWTITPADVQAKFAATQGMDPIFRTNDGSNCPSADVSTVSSRSMAYSQLLTKGLIRVSETVPANAEFEIVDIQDPYNCPETNAINPAMYRRPLPATNLNFLSTIMWDGRETVFGATPGKSIDLNQSLINQAIHATSGHAQGTTQPTPQQLSQIVAFETGLFTAQEKDQHAGSLTTQGALGGPVNLSRQNTFVGINDSLGGDPTGATFMQTCSRFIAHGRMLVLRTGSQSRGEKICSTIC
jgi:cytochrome c peroxidase